MDNLAGATCSGRFASLLPYLQPGDGRERLKLSLLENEGGGPRSYPFDLLDDSAPYCRLLQAAVLTDAGTVLKMVVLQLQKDHYPSPADPLRPVTNRDIDHCWQEAFTAQLGHPEAVLLSSQTDRDKRLVPQAPLFYCRENGTFFHPVCPSCGLPLSLCTDDGFLKRTGLVPYATSLKRYLHCPACCQLGLQEIYLYERDHADPLSLKDRWSLTEAFAAVDETMDPEESFPCARCSDHDVCFGQQALARIRIIPFSFYPFHMLLRSAPSLRAADFVAQLAGAPRGEQQPKDPELEARGDATLFPAGDRCSFLEILFLKLSFLHEVLLQALRRKGDVAGMSMERIWVSLSPLSRSLPLFWNFSVTIFEPVTPAAATPVGTERCAPLGVIWFRALLSSRNVTATDLLHAVVDHLALPRGADRETPSDTLAELLVPQNTYWEPKGGEVPAEWRTMWERACSLGLNLLQGSAEEALGPLKTLLSELQGALLATPAAPERSPQPRPHDEAVIHSVVGKLIQRYKALDEARVLPEADELAATRITPLRHDPATAPPAAEDPLMETVLIPQVVKESLSPEAEWGDQPVMETVILSVDAVPGSFPVGNNSLIGPQQEGPDLLETVLLGPPRVGAKDQRE